MIGTAEARARAAAHTITTHLVETYQDRRNASPGGDALADLDHQLNAELAAQDLPPITSEQIDTLHGRATEVLELEFWGRHWPEEKVLAAVHAYAEDLRHILQTTGHTEVRMIVADSLDDLMKEKAL